jgi:hypothetical protein
VSGDGNVFHRDASDFVYLDAALDSGDFSAELASSDGEEILYAESAIRLLDSPIQIH